MGPEKVVTLDQAIRTGPEEVVTVLSGLSEKDRRELAPEALTWFKNWWSRYGEEIDGVPHATLSETVTLAVMGTATLTEIKKHKVFGTYDEELALRLLADRRPDWLQPWSVWFLEEVPARWRFVRALEKRGLIERPVTDFYVLGMIVSAQRSSPLEMLRDDPELLREIPRLFQVEGGGENSLAAFDKYVRKEGWAKALIDLSASGEVSRDELLNLSLHALSLDFATFRAGWHSRFHEALKPTVKERCARADAYLNLLNSQVGPTQTLALKALVKIAKKTSLDLERLDSGLRVLWVNPAKTTAGLLLRLVQHLPEEKQTEHMLEALLHPHIDIVEAAFDRLTALSPRPDEPLRAQCLELTPELPATLLPRWQSWLGETVEVESDPLPQLAGKPTFAPVERCRSGDEVCGLAAQLLEGSGSALDIERCLDGMLAHRGQFPRQDALVKRSRHRLESAHFTAPLAAVISTWCGQSAKLEPPVQKDDFQGFLCGRLAEVNELLKQTSQSRRLLSLPSTEEGFVAANELSERLRVAREQPYDFAQLLLRLPPNLGEVSTEDNEVAHLVSLALGTAKESRMATLWPFKKHSSLEVCRRAAREAAFHRRHYEWSWNIRTKTHTYDNKTYTNRFLDLLVPQGEMPWTERPEDNPFWRRWESLACPVGRKRWLLRGIDSIANNIDWWGADWADIVYLEDLARSSEPWGQVEACLVAFGMGCEEPGQFGLAVEQAARALQWGGLAPERLGDALVRCADTQMIKMNRWARALQELSTLVSPETVCKVGEVFLRRSQVDFGKILPVLAELAAQCDFRFAPDVEPGLQVFTGKGKSARAAALIRARCGA